ncbi:conserved hypothetical protein [Streptomyces clavuligerus]|nr:conserved hypothetical protein [Streptomyces clavuligerus]
MAPPTPSSSSSTPAERRTVPRVLTLHTADVLLTADGSPVPGPYAVLVGAGRIVALGPAAELAGAHPGARERRWPGVLTAGLWHTRAAELLQGAYHPDPREADALGTEPLTGAALSALAPDGTRWGGSDRRGE